jgi:hypothetical protein
MKLFLRVATVLLITVQTLQAQTVLWAEDFEAYALNTGIMGIDVVAVGDYPAGVPFVIDESGLGFDNDNDYVRIAFSSSSETNSHLEARDLDGEAIITFNAVSISQQSGDVTIAIDDFDFNITSSTSAWSGDEYADVLYSLDGGGSYILIEDFNNAGITGHTFMHENPGVDGEDYNTWLNKTINPGSASSIILRIVLYNTGGNEEFEIDDISISRGGVVLWSDDFEGYTNISGVEGTETTAMTNAGDYPGGVTKWSLSTNSPSQLLDSDDFAMVTDVSVNGTKVLKYNDVNDVVILETEAIDVAGQSTVTFSADIIFDEVSYDAAEYVDVYYALDGGSYQLVQDNGSGHTFSGGTYDADSKMESVIKELTNLSATSLKLRIAAITTDALRDYEFDNIQVEAPVTTDVDTNLLKEQMHVYPNPVTGGILYLIHPGFDACDVQIMDLSGRILLEQMQVEQSVNVGHLRPGVYLVKCLTGAGSMCWKISIK